MKRYRLAQAFAGEPVPDEPYVLDFKVFDIPATMRAAIRNCTDPNVRAITFAGRGLPERARRVVERECRAKNIRALWR